MIGTLAASCGGDQESWFDAGVEHQAIGINGPGGWLEGTAHAAGYTGIAVPLTDAAVSAQNIMTGVSTPAVLTDIYGGFRIPVVNGSYKLCWTKSGFTAGCTGAIYTISNKSKSVTPLALTAVLARKVRGSAQLADASACLTQDAFMSVEIHGTADLLSPTNAILYTTKLNFRGEWVLPNPGTGHKVRITCGSLTAEAQTSSMPASEPFRFTLPNSRPVIRPIYATVDGVESTLGVLPGTTLLLSTAAIDPDGDPLTFGWKATQGTLVDTGTPHAAWTVPTSPGTFTAYLSANDSKGGYATRAVNVRVRTDPHVVFAGNVRDDAGNVLAGALVTVGAVTSTSDAAGHFVMTLPEAPRYLLNISKMGYAAYSRPMRAPSRGRKYVLNKASAKPFNPRVDNVFVDDQREHWMNPCAPVANCRRTGGRVTLPANSVLLSPPPVGGLTMYLSTYDANTEAIPGDQTGIAGGTPVALGSYGSLFVEIRDSVGTTYNLAPGRTAKIEIPFQGAIVAEGPPASMDMWKYDPVTGEWNKRGVVGAKVGNYYVLNVPNFSDQNADIEMVNPSCLYVDVADEVLAQFQMSVKLQVPTSLGGAVRVYDISLDGPRTAIYNLPTALPYTLEVFEVVNGQKVLKQPLTGLTGAAWGGVGNPGLNQGACVVQDIKLEEIAGANGAFSRYLDRKGVGNLAQAQAYYLAIDPAPARRATLGGFWKENGFKADGSADDQHSAAFINFNDLGFGRDMHCRNDTVTGNVACYVTNYGAADQAPGNYDLAKLADQSTALATVAMEYSPPPTGGAKIVKFYVYAGGVNTSPRVESADLDGAGQKSVPNLCLNCHGGTYDETTTPPFDIKTGASFREFDIYSYRDGTLGDKPNELASGMHAIVNTDPLQPPLGQQDEFLELNKIVRASQPESAITSLINQWYHNTDTLPFDQNAVPTLWNTDPSTADLYLKVVAKSCRTCHLAQPNLNSNSWAWATYDQFRTAKIDGYFTFAVCYGDPSMGVTEFEDAKRFRFMPHANITFKNFWLDPDAYNTLGNYTGPGWTTSINSETSAECVP